MITLHDLERDFPELTVISSPNSDIASEMITGISSWSRSEKTEVGVAYSRSQIEQCRRGCGQKTGHILLRSFPVKSVLNRTQST